MQNVIPVSLAQGRGYRGICGKRNFPQAPFERYADDGMIHCRTREEELSKFDFLARENAKRYNIHINDIILVANDIPWKRVNHRKILKSAYVQKF